VSIPLPDGWIKVTLGEITEPRREIVAARSNGGRYLGLENVEARTTKVLGSGDGATIKGTAVKFQAGDTLYARLRPYLNKVCTPDFEGVASGEFIVFPAVDWLAPKFLTYFLNQPDVVAFANAHSTGTHRPRIKWDDLSTYPVLLPPLAEQRRIVAAIEALFSRIDAGVEALQRARRNLQRMRAAVLQAAVTGRLVERAASDGTVAPLLVDLEISESRLAERVAPLFNLPEHWAVVTLGQIAETRLGKMLSKAAKRGDNPKPYLRNLNVQWWRFDLSDVATMDIADDERERFRLRSGDLMVCEGGYAGRCAVWRGQIEDCYYQKALHRLRPLPGVAAEYLAIVLRYYAENRLLGRFITGTTIEHLPQEDLRALPIPLPPTAEQYRIVAEVDRQFSLLSEIESTIDTVTSRAGNARRAILQEAFQGRLVAQNESDEPASMLLQRLKASHDGQGAGTPNPRRSRR
jgi:type I restriction enzyme S subunit